MLRFLLVTLLGVVWRSSRARRPVVRRRANPCTLISNADLQAILHQELTALVVPRHCARPSTGSGWGRSNPVFVSLDCFVVLRAPCNDDRGQGNFTGTNFVVKS
jgi:hypothetical protein